MWFTKDDLMQIVRKAMREAGITDQDEAFVQTVAELMYEAQRELERREG